MDLGSCDVLTLGTLDAPVKLQCFISTMSGEQLRGTGSFHFTGIQGLRSGCARSCLGNIGVVPATQPLSF